MKVVQNTPDSSKSLASSNSKESGSNKLKPYFTFPKAKASTTAVGFLSTLISESKTLEVSEVLQKYILLLVKYLNVTAFIAPAK
jgi:hypothetical protein